MAGTLTDRLNNAFAGGVAIKSPCRVASTANLTLSGYQTVDGIAIGASDATADLNMRILVKNQTNSSANGIYVMGTGTWSRARDFDGARDVLNGTLVWVSTGASQGGGFYNVTNADPVTPDTSTAITFTAADVIAAAAAASSAAAFAACAYVAAGSAYVAANSAYVAAGSAYVAANSAYAAAGSAFVALSCANTAAGSAIVAAASAYVAANSAYVAAGSAYVAAGSAITNATSAATAAGSAIVAAASAYVAANSAYVAAGCAYAAAACAYVAAGCAAGGGTVGAGTTGKLAFYSSATTPVVQMSSGLTYDLAGGLTLGASGVTAGTFALASTGGGNTTIRGSTAAIAHTLVFPSSLGSSGQFVRLLASGLTDFATALSSASTGQIAFYSSALIVRGASEITYDSVGGLALGSSGVTAGALTLASTGGGNTIIRGSTAAVAYSFVLPSSLGSSGQVVQLNAGGVLGFAAAAGGGIVLQVVHMAVVKATGTTEIPDDDTIPVSTEGTQVGTQAIVMADNTNEVIIAGSIMLGTDAGTAVPVELALFRGTTCIAVRIWKYTGLATAGVIPCAFFVKDAPATSGSVTYSLRAGSGDTTTTWGVGTMQSAVDDYGGVMDDQGLYLLEISA